jgi:cytoskeletal protein CcmA (bactofilin family)
VIGNVVAPRISLESGARFDGSVTTTKDDARVASAETVSKLASGVTAAR